MKIGFTGSRTGMSDKQKEGLVIKLQEFSFSEFHHGDCKGADEEAHAIVREIGRASCRERVSSPV